MVFAMCVCVCVCVCVLASEGTLNGFFSNDGCLQAVTFQWELPKEVFYHLILVLTISDSWIILKVARSNLGFLKISEVFCKVLLGSLRENVTHNFIDFCLKSLLWNYDHVFTF